MKDPTKPLLWLMVLLLSSGNLLSQEEYTLQECRQLALENNKKIAIARENQNAAQSMKGRFGDAAPQRRHSRSMAAKGRL